MEFCGDGPLQHGFTTKDNGPAFEVAALFPVVSTAGLPSTVQNIAVGVPIETIGVTMGGLKF